MDNIAKTAFIVAQWRADEESTLQPLFTDPVAPCFLDKEHKKLGDQLAAIMPAIKTLIRYRTKYLDDSVADAIRRGIKQILILGAGFDARAVRYKSPAVRYFEADREELLRYKAKRLRDGNWDDGGVAVACDYLRPEFFELARAKGFRSELPTFILWEGNTMYLTYEQNVSVLRKLAACIGDFEIAFDYISGKIVSRTTGVHELTHLTAVFEKMGSPWLTGFDQLETFASEAGLVVKENFFMADLAKKYMSAIGENPRIFTAYSVCKLINRAHDRFL